MAGDIFERAIVRLEPWGADDVSVLQRLLSDSGMMEHLGGPMSVDEIVVRQQRYERLRATSEGEMFKIVEVVTGAGVGSIGYWERETSEGTVRDGLAGVASLPRTGRRDERDRTGNRTGEDGSEASIPRGLPLSRQRGLEHDLPQAWLRARRDP
jgi:hypothetical protein